MECDDCENVATCESAGAEEFDGKAESCPDFKASKIPKCPKCGNRLNKIIEDIMGKAIYWELDSDGKFHVVDDDTYGETHTLCGYCEAEISGEDFKFFLDNVTSE